MIKPYHKTDKREGNVKKQESKKREDHRLCTLLFCQEVGCSASFDSPTELEEHELLGVHTVPTDISGMDKVKKLFIQKMKGNHQTHSQQLGAMETETSADWESTLHKKLFGQKGWALPKRNDFRYTERQKVLLYNFFIEVKNLEKRNLQKKFTSYWENIYPLMNMLHLNRFDLCTPDGASNTDRVPLSNLQLHPLLPTMIKKLMILMMTVPSCIKPIFMTLLQK